MQDFKESQASFSSFTISFSFLIPSKTVEQQQDIIVRVANIADIHFAETITNEMEASAKARGTGIAKRNPEYIENKILEGKAVIAVTTDSRWVGFCYIETWSGSYVANSGLIVAPEFRKSGVAKRIKQAVFNLSRDKISNCKNIWFNHRACGNENQQRTGL